MCLDTWPLFLYTGSGPAVRGAVPSFNLDESVIDAIQERCRAEKRIPLTNEALAVCRAMGLQTVTEKVIQDASALDRVKMNYPAVLKLLSREASHKTDVGGVRIDIPCSKGSAEGTVRMRTLWSR